MANWTVTSVDGDLYVTQREFNIASERMKDERYSASERADYEQACRFFVGIPVFATALERAVERIRTKAKA